MRAGCETMSTASKVSDLNDEVVHLIRTHGHSVNYYPPYVFVQSGAGVKIFADLLSTQKHAREPVLEIFTTSPVVRVLRLANEQFYVVEENGHVQCWSSHVKKWSLCGQFDLFDSQSSKVKSAVFHEEFKTMFWCEELAGGCHVLCKRTLPYAKEALSNATVGSRMELVRDLTPCDLYTVGNCLLVWPCPPCPPGLFMKWFPHQTKLEVHVVGKGCVATRDITVFSESVNFARMSMQLVAVWSKPNNLAEVHWKAMDWINNRLLVMAITGKVFAVSSKSGIHHLCQLGATVEADQEWCLFRLWLVKMEANKFSFYDFQSGQHSHDVDKSMHGSVVCIWSHSGTLQNAGFITNTAIYQFQIKGTKTVNQDDTAHIPSTVLKDTSNLDLPLELLNTLNLSKSPGLMLPLLHSRKELQRDQANLKQTSLTICNQFPSGLNETVASHVRNYWEIQDCINSLFDETKSIPEVLQSTVHAEVLDIVGGDMTSELESRRARLELLAKQFPADVLESLLDYLDFGTEAITQDIVDKWQSVLVRESSETGKSTLSLFEVIARLLFIQQPSGLIKFIAAAHNFSEKAGCGSAFARRKHLELSLYERALECIPSPNMSISLEDAVLCKAQLLLKRGDVTSSVTALQILQDHGLWEAGLGLLKHLQQSSGLGNEFFHILLSSALKSGVFARYSSEIMALMPKSFKMPVFLELLHKHLPDRDAESVFVGAGDGDVPYECLQSYLLDFLKKS